MIEYDYFNRLTAREYIDFDGFGQAKLENLDHCFTEDGLLIYKVNCHGVAREGSLGYHGNDFEMGVIMENADEQSQNMGGLVT